MEPRDPPAPITPFGDLVLRTPPNWTVAGFVALLGSLHLMVAIPTLLHGRWEGYLSLIFGTIFVLASAIVSRCGCEMSVQTGERRLRLRTGMHRFCTERFVPFSHVHGVRLTALRGAPPSESMIELLCSDEDITCPPTAIPRQQALFLAIVMNVPLIKVSDDEAIHAATDRQQEFSRGRY